MECPRCAGFMLVDQFQDLLDDTGQIDFYGLHCLICGEILDPLILTNRELSGLAVVH